MKKHLFSHIAFFAIFLISAQIQELAIFNKKLDTLLAAINNKM